VELKASRLMKPVLIALLSQAGSYSVGFQYWVGISYFTRAIKKQKNSDSRIYLSSNQLKNDGLWYIVILFIMRA